MKTINYFVTGFFALVLIGCAKDQSLPEAALTDDINVPTEIQAIIDAADAELEYDYKHPPVYDGNSLRSTVYLPAGSQDGLANAISQAGIGGKIVVKSGDHWESGTVTITKPVTIIGENGAKIYFDVSEKGGGVFSATTNIIDPAIYVNGANFVRIKGLHMVPTKSTGNTAIFLEDAKLARIEDNRIEDYQHGIWASGNSHSPSFYDNYLTNSFTSGNLGIGMIVESGKNAKIKGNFVENFNWGLFASDKKGIAKENEFNNNGTGIIFCSFQGNIQLPNGNMLERADACNNWKVIKNEAQNSSFAGYNLIDGAHDNFLNKNQATNSGAYDVILFGPLTINNAPALAASNNFVLNPKTTTFYRDCGENNVVLGGTEDPCQ